MIVFAFIGLVALILFLLVSIVYKVPFFSYKKIFVTLFIILVIMFALLVNITVKHSKKNTSQIINYNNRINQQDLLLDDFNNYKSKKNLVVGVLPNVYPWIYKSKTGKIQGYSIDLIKMSIRTMGKKYIIKEYTDTNSLYKALDNKEIDIIGNLNVVNKQNSKYDYSIKIVAPPLVFVTTSANKNKVEKFISSIKNQVVAVPAYVDLTNYEYSNKILSESKVKVLDNTYEVIDNIDKGLYKYGVIDYFAFLSYVKLHKKTRVIYVGPLIESELTKGISFVINKDSFTLKKQLGITLSFLKQKGSMSNLSLKYFNQDVTL